MSPETDERAVSESLQRVVRSLRAEAARLPRCEASGVLAGRYDRLADMLMDLPAVLLPPGRIDD